MCWCIHWCVLTTAKCSSVVFLVCLLVVGCCSVNRGCGVFIPYFCFVGNIVVGFALTPVKCSSLTARCEPPKASVVGRLCYRPLGR